MPAVGISTNFTTRSFYKARNFFKHASVLENFSDELNLVSIFMAAQGLLLLGVELLEVRMFRRWVMVVEPEMMEVTLPAELLTTFFLTTSVTNLGRYKKNAGATPHALRAAEDTPCKR